MKYSAFYIGSIINCTKVCRYRKQPGKKQHQESIPNCQRSHNAEAGKSVSHTGKKNGKCLAEKEEFLARWMEYCSELYNHRINGDLAVLHCEEPSNSDNCPILQSKVEAAINFLNKVKATGSNNILAKLVQSEGDTLIDILAIICNKIWQSGELPTSWMQSLIITLPKKAI